jgi:uncharacterized surface protein with fasciclin (FAS1) repeats
MNKLLKLIQNKIGTKAVLCFSALSMTFLLSTCSDDVGPDFTTFEEEVITSFLEKDADTYSEFLAILKAVNVSDLLSAYGSYTLFVPTNAAMQKYYEEKGLSFDLLTSKEMAELAYNHILQKEIPSIEFPNGIINFANMDDRFLYISYGTGENSLAVYVNDKSRISIMDQWVHNGIIHTIDAVLVPSKIQLPDVIADDSRFSLFTKALFETGMSDSMRLLKDESYVSRKITSAIYNDIWNTPPFRKFGYTAFVVSDSTFAGLGVTGIENLKSYAARIYDDMYPEDKEISDVTDRHNSLNRFISYHLLGRQQAANEFITADMEYYNIPGATIYEYIETMCPNTLMEIQMSRGQENGAVLFNKLKTGSAIHIIDPNYSSENGVYHEIDKPLVYDRNMENDVLNKRIRIDCLTMCPELITNKIRGNYDWFIIPPEYLDDMKYSEGTQFHYKRQRGYRAQYGDEIILGGKYDCELRIPPIPAGTYEVRLGFSYAGQRGVAQIYLDGDPCGLPIDMTITGLSPKIGWVADDQTEDNGIENDKMMHNRGWMKGPNSTLTLNATVISRNYNECLRRVLTVKTFEKTEPHVIRFKSVEERGDREFQVDYMDFVPSSFMEKEGRD